VTYAVDFLHALGVETLRRRGIASVAVSLIRRIEQSQVAERPATCAVPHCDMLVDPSINQVLCPFHWRKLISYIRERMIEKGEAIG